MPHNFECQRRKRHTDENFGDADASRLARHDTSVRTAGEYAAAGDGVAIDRPPPPVSGEKYHFVKTVKGWQELADIVSAALAQSLQIDASRKDLALPGQHHSLCIRITQIGKAVGNGIAEFNIKCVGFAMHQRENGNSVDNFAFDHARCSAGVICGA